VIGECTTIDGLSYRVCSTSLEVVATGEFDTQACAAQFVASCVVYNGLYAFEACAPGVEGFAIRWSNPRVAGDLFRRAEVELRVRIQ
jgi:hypothetical protein